MVVIIEEETGNTSTIIKDVDEEVLVRHFCLEAEAQKLMAWCDTNRKRGIDVKERIESADVLKKKGNDAAKNLKWSIATWLYLAALHHVDFSQKDAAAMATEGDDAKVIKDQVNAVTLLILLNLTLSFLKTGDNYNSDRCATLALWYADRRNKDTVNLSKDPVRAKLFYRRGAARFALNQTEKQPNRFAAALKDLEEALVLEKELGGDDSTAKLLEEVKAAHEKAMSEDGPKTLEEAMQSDDWMGPNQTPKPPQTIVTASDVGNAIEDAIQMRQRQGTVSWDVVGQLKEKFRNNVKTADWSKVPQKLMFLALLEALLVYFKAPGSEHITPFSALVPFVMIMVRPFMTVVTEEENKDVLLKNELRKMALRTEGTVYNKKKN